MKIRAVPHTYLATLLSLLVTICVSCSQNTQSQGTREQTKGTTDGNGGNGLKGKVYETYTLDPSELSAFKNIIVPKAQRLIKILKDQKHPYGDFSEHSFQNLFISKKWYLIPTSLQSLNKDKIGVAFLNANTEQLAIQTASEIWIDKIAFDKMSETEQANLIVHEMIMNAYTNLQRSPEEICQILGVNENCGGDEHLKSNTTSQQNKTLNEKDYQRIRTATADFMNFNENTSYSEIKNSISKLTSWNNLLSPDLVYYEGIKLDSNKSFSALNSLLLLKAAVETQQLSSKCIESSEKYKNCSLQIDIQDGKAHITILDSKSQETLRSFEFKYNNTNAFVQAYQNSAVDEKPVYFQLFLYEDDSGFVEKSPEDKPSTTKISNRIKILLKDTYREGFPNMNTTVLGVQFAQNAETSLTYKNSAGQTCDSRKSGNIKNSEISMGIEDILLQNGTSSSSQGGSDSCYTLDDKNK